ncbi:response regulator [Stenotrophomonas sp. NPDC077659]|uniref:response regulator n=1 Tax=Stenotrophomonas sp. NPDC077659 TaxID=3390694 RepID=UPI003D031ECA
MNGLRVVLADDHLVVRIGARFTIESTGVGTIVGEAATPEELLRVLSESPCDILVTDFTMAGGELPDGLAMLGRIRRQHPELPIVLLSVSTNLGALRAAKNAGVLGFVDKHDVHHDSLPKAIASAYRRRPYVSPSLQALIDSIGNGRFAHPESRGMALTAREHEVLRLLGTGMTIKQIAQQQVKSISTISRQKSDAMHKLGLANDAELFDYLRQIRQ